MRVKLLRDYKGFEKGEIHHFREALALKLVRNGIAIITKDIVPDDYKINNLVGHNPRNAPRQKDLDT